MAHRSGWKVRPLLDASREQIAVYARDREIPFREDSSNTDRRFLRNRVRHELLPLLVTYNPLITRSLGSTAAILAADDEVLSREVGHRFVHLVTVSERGLLFPVNELLHEPAAIRFRLYRRAIKELNGDLRSIAYRHLLAVDRLLLHEAPSCSVSLPRSLRAGRSYGSLRFFGDEVLRKFEEFRIVGFGTYPLHEGELTIGPVDITFRTSSLTPDHALIDLDAAPFPWHVRSFREGDRMIPFGMTGSKKLKDIFIDTKIPCHLRRRLPLLCDTEGRILSALGVRRSAVAVVTAVTRTAALAELRKCPPVNQS
jgi:tRNA(Ile)-lysidine synthase